MPDAQTESLPITNRWTRVAVSPPPEGVEVDYAEDGKLWRYKPRKVVHLLSSQPDPEAERLRIEAKQEQQFERHVIDVMKARYLAEFEAPE